MRLVLLLLLGLSLSACQLWPKPPLYYAFGGGGYQLLTQWPGPSQQLLQQVQFKTATQQQEFLLSVQLLPEQILLVALSPLGQELGRVELTADGRLQQQGHAPFSEPAFALQLLAQMQWSLWPVAAIQPRLSGLLLQQKQQQRLLLDNKLQQLLLIQGAGSPVAGQITEINQQHYQLRLTTLQQDFFMTAAQFADTTQAPVLTALGICCALGASKQQVWQAAVAGSRAGMVWRDDLLLAGQAVVVGAVTEKLPQIDPAFAHLASRNNQLAYSAYLQIADEVAQAKHRYGAARIAVVLGSSTSGIADGEDALQQRVNSGSWPADYHYQKQEMAAPAHFIATVAGVAGPAYVISTACSSSARALISARNLLTSGMADAVIVGGVDSLCRMTLQGFAALESVAAGFCQPFAEGRDGINIGEGAALFLMLRQADATAQQQPGVQQLIELAGTGAAADAYHMSAPHPEGRGAEAAIRQALAQACISAGELGYINLHGTATPLNDAMESTVLQRLGAAQVPASSTKSLTGHTLGAAGAIEAALCWLLLSDYNAGFALLPQVRDNPADATLPTLNFVQAGQQQPLSLCLSNSFCFWWQQCCRYFEKTTMISGYSLEQLLPHDHPMILLSRFIVADEHSVQTEVEISSNSPFFQQAIQAVPAYVGLEYMAQTIACYAGANALWNGDAVKIGFLLGCRKYAPVVSQFAAGTLLQLKAEKVVSEESGLSVFLCEISANGFVLVQANLNVFQPENHLDWLKEF